MPPQVSDVLHGQSGRVCGKLMVELVTQAFYWLVVSIPLKNMKVNWDDYAQHMEKYGNIKHVPNHQPVMFECLAKDTLYMRFVAFSRCVEQTA